MHPQRFAPVRAHLAATQDVQQPGRAEQQSAKQQRYALVQMQMAIEQTMGGGRARQKEEGEDDHRHGGRLSVGRATKTVAMAPIRFTPAARRATKRAGWPSRSSLAAR